MIPRRARRTQRPKMRGALGSSGDSTQNSLDYVPVSNRRAKVHVPPVVRFTPNVFGFPDRLLTRLRYCDQLNITIPIGAIAKQQFRWNSLFDPDFTNIGHQPLYFDTFAAVYDQYAVVSAKATIVFMNYDNTVGQTIGLITDDDTSTSNVLSTLMEQSHSVTTDLTPLSGSRSQATLVSNWDCVQVLGIDPFASETYKTAVTGNPAEISTLTAFASTTNALASTIQLKITFEYNVLWTELTTPTGS